MARIRTIKPELWQDEKLGRLPMETRLLFIGLVSHADDDGRLRGAPELLRAQIFPYDTNFDPKNSLKQLEESGCVICYEAHGEKLIQLVNWRKHQVINHYLRSKLSRPPTGGLPEKSGRPTVRKWNGSGSGSGSGMEVEPSDAQKARPGSGSPNGSDISLKTLCDSLVLTWKELKGVPYAHAGAKDTQALKRLRSLASDEFIAQLWRDRLVAKDWPEAVGIAQFVSQFNAHLNAERKRTDAYG